MKNEEITFAVVFHFQQFLGNLKTFLGFNGIWIQDLYLTDAMLYQLNHKTTASLEEGQMTRL